MAVRNATRAFTLIELLTVVAVLGVLVALAFPVLHHVRGSGQQVVCQSNLRQLFLAQASYEIDAGRFTRMWTEGDPTGWKRRLSSYASGADPKDPHHVFHCPAVGHEELAKQPTDAAKDQHPASVGLNGAMQFAEWGFRSEAVPQPSRIIALGEQAVAVFEGLITADGYGVWAAEDQMYANWYATTNHNPTRGFRHGNATGANFALMDGHVESLPQAELVRESGRWYWWDALDGDTSKPGDGTGLPYSLSPAPSPNPTPTPPSHGGAPDVPPEGPLEAPCGCPL